MKKVGASFELTATDLVGYLNCHHLSDLDRAVAEGSAAKPTAFDPLLAILWERGLRHEKNYIEHLTETGLDVVRINGADVAESAVSETFVAMKKGVPVIAQGALARQASRPSALAVFRLINNSTLVGNSTGRSPGLLPFKILST